MQPVTSTRETARRAGASGPRRVARVAHGVAAVHGPAPVRTVVPPAMRSDALAGRLARSVAGRAPARMLQRAPTARQITPVRPMSVARITGASPKKKQEIFQALRATHTADAHAVLTQLESAELWGAAKSDVTGDDEEHSVRIDRQNPTPTASNVQIQTNGESVTIATVLVQDAVANQNAGAVLNAARQAFRASLVDGMQWEVYNEQVVEKEAPYVKGGKGGKGGKKGGGPGKKGGGPGKPGRRSVNV